MDYNFMNVIFLFGGLQALLLIIGINLKEPLKSTKKKATTLMLFFSLMAMVYYFILVWEWNTVYTYFWFWGSISWMALMPAYYIFSKSLTLPKYQLGLKDLVVFTVPILFLIDSITIICFEYSLLYERIGFMTYLDKWMLIFFLCSSFYVVLTFRTLLKHKFQALSKALLFFTSVIGLSLMSYAIVFIVTRENYSVYFEFSLICILVALIFCMVFRVFRLVSAHSLFAEPKYQNHTVVTNDHYNVLKENLSHAIHEKEVYKDPTLTLPQLAGHVGFNQNQLSQYFNIQLQSSFYEYINEHRLLHVEKLIEDGEFKELTINGLALESGFKSKTTFYKVFKEKHQLTPTQYIKLNQP